MLHRIRICMIGSEEVMKRIFRRMLANCAYYEDDEIPEKMEDLLEKVQAHAKQDGASGDLFLYEMIAPRRYADAEPGTCRLEVQAHVAGLYTACFAYDSAQDFQAHDWLDLHQAAGMPLTVVQRAAEDFTLEKGEVLLVQGQAQDNWDNMSECWLWLMEQYECGLPPEEAVDRLRRLDRVLKDEEYDMDVAQLLRSCISLLKGMSLSVQDTESLGKAMEESLSHQDYTRRMELEYMLCESVLWETQHLAKWEASLQAVLEAWDQQ